MHRQGLRRSVLVSFCLVLACGDDGVAATAEESSSDGGESSSTNPATTIVDDSTSSTSDTATSTESSGDSADSSSSTGAPDLCGNGELDDGEECDDSNVANGDACKADCTNAFEIAWTVTHDGDASHADSVSGMSIDAAGNIYVVGGEGVSGQNGNVWLQQYLPDGSEGWTYRYDGAASGDDYGADLFVTDDGDFIIVGSTETDMTYTDLLILRLDGATQMLEWEVVVDGPGSGSDANDYDWGSSIAATDDGGFVVTGAVSTDDQADDVWLGRYDGAGAEIWTATHDDDTHAYNRGHEVLVAPTGDIYVFVDDYANLMSTGSILAFDADGALLDAQPSDVAFEAAAFDADGNFVVTGSAAPANTLLDAVTRKYDPDFTLIWEAVFDGSFDFDFPYGLHIDDAGNVYVVGYTSRVNEQGNAFIEVYDADGNPLWGDEFNDELDIDESWSAVATDAMGDVVIGGYAPVLGHQADTFTRKYHPL